MRDKGNKKCYNYALGGCFTNKHAAYLQNYANVDFSQYRNVLAHPLRSIVRSWVGLDNAVFNPFGPNRSKI